MIAKIALCLVSILVIVVLVSSNVNHIFSSTLYYSIIMLVGTVLLPMWFFQGIEKIPVISFLMVVTKLLSLPLFFIYVKDNSDIGIAILIQSSTNFIVGFFAIIYIVKNKLLVSVKYKELSIYKSIHEASPIFLASFAISLYTMSTTIIISLSSSIAEVGLFSCSGSIKRCCTWCFLHYGECDLSSS